MSNGGGLTGPACDSAAYATITAHSYGASTYTTPIFPIATLDSMMAEITNTIGPIISVQTFLPDGNTALNCCPAGFNFDPSSFACIPIVQNPQPPPPAPTPPAPPAPTCPPGYTYNPETNSCVTSPIVVLPIPIPPGGQGGGGGGGTTGGGGSSPSPIVPVQPPPMQPPIVQPPQGPVTEPPPGIQDELGTCCTNITTALGAMTTALQALAPDDPTCCTDTLAQLNGIALQLQSIAGILANPPAPPVATPVDLSGIIAALEALGTAIVGLQTTETQDTGTLQTALAGIQSAIAGITPANTQGITTAIDNLFTTIDVPQAVYNQLQTDGWINPTYTGLVSPGAWGSGSVMAALTWLWQHIEKALGLVGTSLETIAADIEAGSLGATNWLAQKISAAIAAEPNAVQLTLVNLIQALTMTLTPPAGVSPGNIGVPPAAPLAQVTTWDLNLRMFGAMLEVLQVGLGDGFLRIGQRLMELIGAAQIAEVEIGPLIRFGIARIAEQQAKNTYRQELPSDGQLATWVARGLIDQPTAQTYMGLNGLDNTLQTPTLSAAQRGLGTRLLLRAFESGLMTPAVITSELTNEGMRPQSQALLQQLAPYAATTGPRNQLIAAYELAYNEGLYADADFQSLAAGAQQITDLPTLQLTRVQVLALVKQTKELVSSYVAQFEATLIDQPTLENYLAGVGMQQNWITALVAQAAARLAARQERQLLAAETRLQNATNAIIRKTALQNYKSGTIDLAGYTAAILASGLTAAEAALWADYALLLNQGTLQWVYGIQLPRAQATILKQQVDAYLAQLGSGVQTVANVVPALQTLGLSATWINALVAKAEATATTKTLASLYPVLPQ